MTAEVAVYNRSAIALAADSAASISGGGSDKIFNNAEKLFALSKTEPIGIMIYGSSQINGIPWELIIKEYRKQNSENSFDYLTSYAEDFFNFTIEFYRKLKNKLINDDELVLDLSCIDTFDYITQISYQYIDDGQSKDEAFESAADAYLSSIENVSFYDNFSSDDMNEISNKIKESIISLLEEHDLSESSECFDSILKACCEQILKPNLHTNENTGIVFAGYGKNEYFPEIIKYETYNIVINKIRNLLISDEITDESRAGIAAFAQQTEVESFMQGICNSITNLYKKEINEYRKKLGSIIKETLDLIPDNEEKLEKITEIKDLENKYIDEFRDNVSNHISEHHVDKVVDMIEHLPKNELAYMAESLVNLTAFKRKVSNGQDSVGGPIDVAVISKGEGFVWIKRKHYFPNELNRNYK